uniref:Maestro heat-like repeat family member 1 n=1 Tax=Takifugu rubripes TaxID=31033 RepID=A0A674NSG4_TAKRU
MWNVRDSCSLFSKHFAICTQLLLCCVFTSEVTLALLDAATDKDFKVQEQVRKSVLTLGKQQPDRVLAICQDYLLKHPKLSVAHRVVILQTIELIVGSRIEQISYPRIKSIISLASDEMTRSKVIPDWQQAASNILVAVGKKHINDIMEEILSKFQPGLLPHFFVVKTLASLSDSNVYGMVPFLNAILGTMLPMLNMAKQDNMKWVFSSALCHFSESILEYLANLDKAPDPTVRKDTFSSEICASFDILFNSWLQSRESKLRLTVAEAVGSMCHLMAGEKLEEQIPKLIPAILSLYKKNNEHYIISKSLCQVLDASLSMGSRVLETQLDSLLVLLVIPVFSLCFCMPLLAHTQLYFLFPVANSFPDRLVMFVLQKLENGNERSRVGSLAVLRHLINSSTSTMESKKLGILASIRQPMADHSNKVKKRVIQVISAMAHHGYLELEGGELLVRFIVQHCALPDTGQTPQDQEEVTNEALRTMCDSTLHLLTTTVGQLDDVLWPKLLYYLTPIQYSNATTPLCKSLIVLGNKKKENQDPSFKIDFTQEGRWNVPYLLPVSLPFNSRGHGAPSLSLLQILSVSIHPKTETLWEKEIPHLLSVLEGTETSKHHVIRLNFFIFLYQCIGVILQQCLNKVVVKKQLQELLLTARHSDAIEREGIAMGVGLCANSHLEGTLAKLEEFGKSDAFKKSPSIFNLLKERSDVEVEKVKSTLILCYGQVALNAPPEKILNHIDQDILRSISKHFNTKVKFLFQVYKVVQIKWFHPHTQTHPFPGELRVYINIYNLFFEAVGEGQECGLYKDTFAALQELLKSVLANDPTPDGLQSFMLEHIEPWLSSAEDHERERAVTATAHMLAYYLDNLNVKNMVSFHNLGALLGRLSPRCSDPHQDVRFAAIDCIYTLLYIQLRYEGFCLDYKDDSVDSLLPLKENLSNPDHSVLYKTCSDLTKRLPQQELTTLVFMLFEGLIDSQTNCCRASSVILNTMLKSRGGGLQELVTHTSNTLFYTLVVASSHNYLNTNTSVLILASQHLQTVVNTLINQPLPYDSWTCEMWMALGADPVVANQIMEMVMEKLAVMAPYVDKKESMIRGGMTKVATNQPLAVSYEHSDLSFQFCQGGNIPLKAYLFLLLLEHQMTAPKTASHLDAAAEALHILLARAQLDEVLKRLEEEKAWDAIKEQNSHISGITVLARAMSKHAGPRLPAIVECLCPSLNSIYESQRTTVTAFFSELLNHHVVTELMLIDVLMNNMMERISDPCCTVRMLAVRGLGNIAVGSPEKVEYSLPFLLAAMSSGMEEKDDPGKLITLEAMSGLSKVLLYLDKKNVHLLVVYIFMKIKPFLESENDEIRCASIYLMGHLSKFGSGEQVFTDQIHNVLVSLLLHLVDPNPQVVKACKFAMRVCAPVVGSEQITAMFQNHLHDNKSLHYGEFINDLTKYLIQDFPGMLNFYHISVIQFFKSNWSEVRAGAAMFIGMTSAIS